MNRRKFIKNTCWSAIAFSLLDPSALFAGNKRTLSITMDDPNLFKRPVMPPTDRNLAILNALKNHNDLKAALFVCGKHIDNPKGKKLLESWDRNGHLIGNHTYSHHHLNSPKIDSDSFIEDIIRCEELINTYGSFARLFRFPFLKEGETAQKRDRIRSFLKKRGYKTGHVTIDTSDWYIEQRMRQRLEIDPDADVEPYRNYYIDHILREADFYDDLCLKVLGYSVKHTLLIHHNILNAMFLSDLLLALKKAGWSLIDAVDAFDDPVFAREPDIVPAGDSIIMALANEAGRFEEYLRYPGEDGKYEEAGMDALGL
ncbi:MAG: polysaccharide deacetylase family protein [candidate division Zixibacteria bacterium]